MLLRKTAWFWKSGLAVISFVLMFSISGCSDTPPEEDTVSEIASYFTYFYCANYGIYANMESLEVIFSE